MGSDEQSRREMKQVAKAIVEARKRAGLTQTQLARAIDTTQSVIAKLESGTTLPRMSSIQRIARATNSRMEIALPVHAPATHKGARTMSFDPRDPRAFFQSAISRRAMLATVGAATAVATRPASAQTPAASPAADVPPNGVQPDGTWVFTDDRGVTVTLPKKPERILSSLPAAAALWDFGIKSEAVFANATPRDNPAWGRVDTSLADLAGSDIWNIDVEELLALDPDIYVSLTWNPDDTTQVVGITADYYEDVNSQVPSICISSRQDIPTGIARIEELALALGASPDDESVRQARVDFETAVENLKITARQQADITMLFVYVHPEDVAWYIASATDWSDVKFYKDLGVNILNPETDPFTYFIETSRERVAEHPADILMNSLREGTTRLEDFKADPVFSRHPAVIAGQVSEWKQEMLILSYLGYTETLNDLSAVLESAQKVT